MAILGGEWEGSRTRRLGLSLRGMAPGQRELDLDHGLTTTTSSRHPARPQNQAGLDLGA